MYLTSGYETLQNYRIERAYLDGTNRTVLVSSGVGYPTSLSVDISTGDLYWSDSVVDAIQVYQLSSTLLCYREEKE